MKINRSAFLIFLSVLTSLIHAQDYIEAEDPLPADVTEIEAPIEEAFRLDLEETPGLPERSPILRMPDSWYRQNPFISDTKLDLTLMSYYFNADHSKKSNAKSWAAGGSVDYQSGLYNDTFGIGLSYYTSQKIYGPQDKGGLGLLKPDQSSISVLGQAYLQIDPVEDSRITVGRQLLDLPFMSSSLLAKMIPRCFEAVQAQYDGIEQFSFKTGHVGRIKPQDSSTFHYLTVSAPCASTSKWGASFAGAYYEPSERLKMGVFNLAAWDLLNSFYTEVAYLWDNDSDIEVRTAVQFIYQTSIGKQLVGRFHTYEAGILHAISYEGFTFSFAGAAIDRSSPIREYWGGSPVYTGTMAGCFDRAGEDMFMVGILYDFAKLGFDGLKAFFNYTVGWGADEPDEQEFAFTVDYVFPQKALEGLWLRLRYAPVDEIGTNANDLYGSRIQLVYELPLL